jgi:hypothetical protein
MIWLMHVLSLFSKSGNTWTEGSGIYYDLHVSHSTRTD